MVEPRPPPPSGGGSHGGAPSAADWIEDRRMSRACSRGGGAAPLSLLPGGWRREGGAVELQRWRGRAAAGG
jgi:hypothetical protein